MTKPDESIQALLMISFSEKLFLHFAKVLDILSLSLSISLRLEATQSKILEKKGTKI